MSHAEQSLFNAGQVMTQFVITTPESAFQIETPWDDPESRAIYYGLMRAYCHAENATAVTMIAEAWAPLPTR